MGPTKELVFTATELVNWIDARQQAFKELHVSFFDPNVSPEQRYIFAARISADLLTEKDISLEKEEQVKSVLFQFAQEYVNDKIWQNSLSDLLPRNDHSLYIYDVEPESFSTIEVNLPLPNFNFLRALWKREAEGETRREIEETYQFLWRVYELQRKCPGRMYGKYWIGLQLGFRPYQVDQFSRELCDEDLLEVVAAGALPAGPLIEITAEGEKRVRQFKLVHERGGGFVEYLEIIHPGIVRETPVPSEVPVREPEVDIGSIQPAPDFRLLGLDENIAALLETRWREAQLCMRVGAHHSAIIIMGSFLEGLLYFVLKDREDNAVAYYKDKNISNSPSKDMQMWNVNELVKVAHGLALIDLDVAKFGPGLRHFRNYVHVERQLREGAFPLDQDTCKVSWEITKAAVNDLIKKSSNT